MAGSVTDAPEGDGAEALASPAWMEAEGDVALAAGDEHELHETFSRSGMSTPRTNTPRAFRSHSARSDTDGASQSEASSVVTGPPSDLAWVGAADVSDSGDDPAADEARRDSTANAPGAPDGGAAGGSIFEDPRHDGCKLHGCAHYRRRCKLLAPCCGRFFWCRFCHNDAMEGDDVDPAQRHQIDRHRVTTLQCALCGDTQPVARVSGWGGALAREGRPARLASPACLPSCPASGPTPAPAPLVLRRSAGRARCRSGSTAASSAACSTTTRPRSSSTAPSAASAAWAGGRTSGTATTARRALASRRGTATSASPRSPSSSAPSASSSSSTRSSASAYSPAATSCTRSAIGSVWPTVSTSAPGASAPPWSSTGARSMSRWPRRPCPMSTGTWWCWSRATTAPPGPTRPSTWSD